jgi:hypothetical protein
VAISFAILQQMMLLVSVSVIIQLQSGLFSNALLSQIFDILALMTLMAPVFLVVILVAFNPRGSKKDSMCLDLDYSQLLS